jgi:hypothetical protein
LGIGRASARRFFSAAIAGVSAKARAVPPAAKTVDFIKLRRVSILVCVIS